MKQLIFVVCHNFPETGFTKRLNQDLDLKLRDLCLHQAQSVI